VDNPFGNDELKPFDGDEIREGLAEYKKKMFIPSYPRLGLTIFLAVFLALFINDEIQKSIATYHLNKELEKLAILTAKAADEGAKMLSREMQRARELNIANQKRAAENQKIRAIETKKQKAIKRQLLQTCNFWRDQYNKTKSRIDKNHRDNACSRAQAHL